MDPTTKASPPASSEIEEDLDDDLDLRRWFITHCIEKGVDVPTIARWVGHSDHGKLLLKTYTFLQDSHSLNEIKKLQ